MIQRLSFDYTNAAAALGDEALRAALERVRDAAALLSGRRGPGAEFLGWLDLPVTMPSQMHALMDAAREIREHADAVIVVGIGGSYLGARAVIDACDAREGRRGPVIHYAGHHVSGRALAELLDGLEGSEVFVNVISKSGTTTEPALAFRVIRHWMERRYGRSQAARRIIATTDASRGALRTIASTEGYRSFVIPDDVGGRFSVLTPVGLLPVSIAGIDPVALLDGAARMRQRVLDAPHDENPALHYAAVRTALHEAGCLVEIFASFHPELHMMSEWWKQLFGESEGKQGRGIFPASVQYTTDLHSMGQYIQDGRRMLFETVVSVARESERELLVPVSDDDLDGMGELAGRTFSDINAVARDGVIAAHMRGGTPTSTITLPDLGPASIGELLFFFETAVAFSGYALGVNPFDQPGVEEYKRSMFALLGRAGYEAEAADLAREMRGRSIRRIE